MFGKLFGRKKIVEDKNFTLDFEDALKRYIGISKGKVEYEFKDEDGYVMPPSYAFQETYNEWKNIQSIWDRRGVIFSALDTIYLKKLPKEQIIERFVIDRYPEKALLFSEKFLSNEDFENPEILASLSKCHFVLSNFEKSIDIARKALKLDENNKKAQIALADSLHLTGKHDEAHDIYSRILENSKLKDNNKESINIIELVGYNNDILNSSVYAISILSNSEVDENIWNNVAGEFYFCPYFRSQHAFWLIKNNETPKGMAKLISTTQEFPWYKDAVINAKSGILQMREQMNSNNLWENELIYLEHIINKNNW